MTLPSLKPSLKPVGQLALLEMFGLAVPQPHVASFVGPMARRTEIHEGFVTKVYPSRLAPQDTPLEHLRFALKHEAFDLGVIVAALEAMGEGALEDWVRAEPTGAYSRQAWFLFERFTAHTLDLEPVRVGKYVRALDPDRFLVAVRRNSTRHRVIDNLLGATDLCPTVRRTAKLETMIASRLDEEARDITARYDPTTLARAVSYLYTKETRSSFDIEREKPKANRTELFVRALQDVLRFNPSSLDAFLRLQNAIVDPRYAEHGWRAVQNFVGETLVGYRERVHFVCPRPEDVPALMNGWMQLTERLLEGTVDPVVAAAVSSFAFVFVHPFQDGNGRIHRFLVHHALARLGFSPPGVVFPVSASILRDRQGYDRALERFSGSIMPFIDWDFTPSRDLIVYNDTRNLYRFFDATPLAEYLFERVEDTITNDFVAELEYLARYDQVLEAIRGVVDMPDRRASLFVRLCLQNGGRLSKGKRGEFSELSDDEIERLEAAVRRSAPPG